MNRKPTIVPSLLAAFVLAAGMNIAWGVLAGWADLFLDGLNPTPFVYEQLLFREDGLPIIDRRDGAHVKRRTLDGKPYAGPQEFVYLSSASLRGPADRVWETGWAARLVYFRDDAMNLPVYWYVIDTGQIPRVAYFEGYDSRTKHRIGYLCRHGFQLEKPRAEACFPVRGHPASLRQLIPEAVYSSLYNDPDYAPVFEVIHLASSDSIYRIELKARKVQKIATVPGIVSLGATSSAVGQARDVGKEREMKQISWSPRPNWLVARTGDEIVMVARDSQERHVFPLPPYSRDQHVNVFGTQDPNTITIHQTAVQEDGSANHRLVWLRSDGTIARESRIALRHTWPFPSDTQSVVRAAVACPAPVGALVHIFLLRPDALVNGGFVEDYGAARARSCKSGWLILCAVRFMAAALAVVTVRHHRKYSQPHAIAWAGFVLLFGIPGFVGYLVHRVWPAREPCPICRGPAPRDREVCSECGEPFPPPPRKGTEVFA